MKSLAAEIKEIERAREIELNYLIPLNENEQTNKQKTEHCKKKVILSRCKFTTEMFAHSTRKKKKTTIKKPGHKRNTI